MPGESKLVECPQCGRLHEIDPQMSGERFECDCGKWLDIEGEDSAPAGQATDGAAGDSRSGSTGGRGSAAGESPAPSPRKKLNSAGALLRRLRRNWRVTVAAVVAVAVVIALVAMWHRPESSLANLDFGRLAPRAPARNAVEELLTILEDDSRAAEHARAAAGLLERHNQHTVDRLCELAQKEELASRPLVIRLLGQIGDDHALPVLQTLMNGQEVGVSRMATAALTQLGTPSAESLLRKELARPERARETLGVIAGVRSEAAARLVSSCLANPALRIEAMDEIAARRLERCIPDLALLARDEHMPEPDRLHSVKTLGQLRTSDARRVLVRLVEDPVVGWQARRELQNR